MCILISKLHKFSNSNNKSKIFTHLTTYSIIKNIYNENEVKKWLFK